MSNSVDSESSDSDIELKSALQINLPKMPKNPSDDVMIKTKKMTTKMMITDALTVLKSRKGVSFYAIKKHLKEKYEVNTEKLNYLLKKNLKAGIEDGTFVQLKGVGASGSFKLADIKEKVKKPKLKPEKEETKEPKEKVEKPKKTKDKQVETKPKAAKKEKTEERKPSKNKVEVKVTKKLKKKEDKVEKSSKAETENEREGKKTKTKKVKTKQSPTKKRAAMMKRKSIGSIIKLPKMKPKHT